MLPNNYKVTELVKALNKGQDYSKMLNEYDSKLTPNQIEELSHIINIHMEARMLYLDNHQVNHFGASAPQAPANNPSRQQPHVTNIYVYNNRGSSLWYDWWFWNTMMYPRPVYQPPHSHTHTHRSKESRKNEPNAAQVLLAIMLALGAAAAMLYSFVELGRCVDQLCYAEQVFSNLSRIALSLVGALAGGIGGYAMGVGLLAMPMVGMIVGSLITAGLMIWASRYMMESVQKAIPSESALNYDSRFCLSSSDINTLETKGHDVLVVSEAIREVAIAYDSAHQKASSIMFWSEDNKEKAKLTDLLRQLKSGLPDDQFEFNEKMFSLKQTIPIATPVEPSAPPLNVFGMAFN